MQKQEAEWLRTTYQVQRTADELELLISTVRIQTYRMQCKYTDIRMPEVAPVRRNHRLLALWVMYRYTQCLLSLPRKSLCVPLYGNLAWCESTRASYVAHLFIDLLLIFSAIA